MKLKITVSPIPKGKAKDRLVQIIGKLHEVQNEAIVTLNKPFLGKLSLSGMLENQIKIAKGEIRDPKYPNNPFDFLETRWVTRFNASSPEALFSGNSPLLAGIATDEQLALLVDLWKIITPYKFESFILPMHDSNITLKKLEKSLGRYHYLTAYVSLECLGDYLIIPKIEELRKKPAIEEELSTALEMPDGKILKESFDMLLPSRFNSDFARLQLTESFDPAGKYSINIQGLRFNYTITFEGFIPRLPPLNEIMQRANL